MDAATLRRANLSTQAGELRRLRAELAAHGHQMSGYERGTFEQKVAAEQARLVELLPALVRERVALAKGDYRDAERALQRAKAKADARWEPQKLGVLLTLAQLQFNRARDAGELQRTYTAALESGDDHKVFAFSQVFSSALTKPGLDDRLAANRLARQAQSKLDALAATPEVAAAEGEQAEVIKAVAALRDDVRTVGTMLPPGVAGQMEDLLRPFQLTSKLNPGDPEHFMQTTLELVEDDKEVS